MSSLRAMLGLARFEMRLGWRMVRVWVLGILCFLVGLFFFAQYTFLNQFSGWLGSGTLITSDIPLLMPALMTSAFVGLVGIFYSFDWRHRDDASQFSPTLDASPLGPVAYAWGKFLGLVPPLALPFLLLLITQLVLYNLPLLDVPTPAPVMLLAYLAVGFLPALVLSALAFGLAGLTGNRAIAIVVPVLFLVATFAIAFTLPEWVALLVGGMYELPIYSNWIGYEPNPLFWLQRVTVAFQLVFFVSLGACGKFAVARRPGLQSRHLIAIVSGGVWVAGLLSLWLVYSGQGGDRLAVIDAERAVAGQPVATVLDRRIDVVLDPGSSLSGRATLSLRNDHEAPVETVALRLNAGLDVTDVTWDGATVPHERDLTVLTVTPPAAWAPGAQAELAVVYEGEPDAASVDADVALATREMSGSLRGNRRFAGTLPLIFEKGAVVLGTDAAWYPEPGVRFGHDYPVRLQPSLAPSRLTVSLPADWTAASAGSRSGGEGQFEFVSEVPVPSLSLNAAHFAEIETEISGVLFRVLHHPEARRNVDFFAEAGERMKTVVAEMMTEAEARTGLSYPHPEFTIVEIPQQVAGYQGGWDKASRMSAPGIAMLREGGVFGARFKWALKVAEGEFDDEAGTDSGGVKIRINTGVEAPEDAESADEATGTDEAAGAEDATGTEEVDDESLTTFDVGRAKMDILERFVRTDWVGGDVPQMAFRNAWDYRVRVEDETAPVLGFSLSNYLGELAFGRAPFDHPDMTLVLNKPEFNQVMGVSAQGGDAVTMLVHAIADMDVVYETMLETALNAVDPQEMGPDFLGLLHLKGREPLRALHDTLGRERWSAAMVELLATHADGSPVTWAAFREATLSRAGEDQRGALDTLFDNWLTGTELPGFVVTDQVAQRLAGEDERWQVTAVVTNKGTAPGVAKLRAGRGDDARTRLVSVAPGEELEVGLLTDDKPRTWALIPYLALNRVEPAGTLETREDPVEAEPFEGVRPAEVLGMAAPVVVDNLDPGFTVTLKDGREVSWDLKDDGERVLESTQRLLFMTPAKWSRWRHSGRFYTPHGLFDVTAAVKTVTSDGGQPAFWRTSLPEQGLYRVEVYLPPNEGRFGGRLVREWSFLVRGSGPEDAVTISTDAAQEGWNDLGRFRFELDAEVELSDRGKKGIVIADAVRFVKESP